MGQAMLNDNIISVKYPFQHPLVWFLELFRGDNCCLNYQGTSLIHHQ